MAEVLRVRIVVLEWCFGVWLLIGYGNVLEPPLLFKSSQPHFRSGFEYCAS